MLSIMQGRSRLTSGPLQELHPAPAPPPSFGKAIRASTDPRPPLLFASARRRMLAPGCAAVKATQQPGKKDLAVLSNGMARTHVIAELGAPVWSDERDGDIVDVFAFKQGYSKGVKAGRL